MTPAQLLAAADRFAREAIADGAKRWRQWRLALNRWLDRLVRLARRAATETGDRLKPSVMALGRRLTTLRLSAERGISLAVARWRRR
jgi:hypothetical protein